MTEQIVKLCFKVLLWIGKKEWKFRGRYMDADISIFSIGKDVISFCFSSRKKDIQS